MLPKNTNKAHVLTLTSMRKRILYRNYRQHKNGKKIARQTILNVAWKTQKFTDVETS